MSFNPWKRLQGLMSGPPLQVGTALVVIDGEWTVQLPGGGILQARGEATAGRLVYVRGGVIEGDAGDPADFSLVVIDI